MSDWAPEHDAMLKDNHEKGVPLSYSQIAAALNDKFGTDYTRNAAVGRAHRIGLTKLRPKGANTGPKTARKPRTTPDQRPDIQIRKATSGPKLPTQPAQLRCDPVKAGTFHVTELEEGMCRYPSGDRDFLFCGLNQAEGMSYCATHCGIAYRADRKAA